MKSLSMETASFVVREEPSLADLTVKILDESGNLHVTAATSDSTPNQRQVCTTIIITTAQLHSTLSLYGPGVLEIGEKSQHTNLFQLDAQRIAPTSAETILRIYGPPSDVQRVSTV